MVTLMQRIMAQAQKPTGLAGWVGAGLMLVEGPSGCYHATMARLLQLRSDDDVLDVACGSGRFLHRYAAHARRVAGLDHSDVQIALARRLLGRRIAEGTAQLVEGDAAALPWADGEFSAVTCNCVGFLAEPERSMAEMFRVLRPAGRLALAGDFFGDATAARRQERWGLHAWTEPELRGLVEDAGFTQVSLAHDAKGLFAAAVKPG